MYICEYCGKEFEKSLSLAGHKSHCVLNPKKRTKEEIQQSALRSRRTYIVNHPQKYVKKTFDFICKKCNKQYTLWLTQEEFDRGKYTKYCSVQCRNSHNVSQETKAKISETLKQFVNNNKNKEKYPNCENLAYTKRGKKVHCICKNCGIRYDYIKGKTYSRIYCSKTCKHSYLSSHTGGKRNGSGRGKKGWYKGIFCDSSWELSYVIYHLDNNLPIKRCTEHRKYIWKNEIHEYIPDFVTEEGIIEIKGYHTEQWQSKIEQNPDIKVLYKKDIEFYLNYCIIKYGKNFTSLYDGSNPSKDISKLKCSWFHKTNDAKKLFVRTLVFKKNYDLYLKNGWKRGGYSSLIYKDYKVIKNNRIYKNITQEEKEKILSNLIK